MKQLLFSLAFFAFLMPCSAQTNVTFFLQQAEEQVHKQNYKMAMDYVKQALEKDKDNLGAIYWRGVINSLTGDFKSAESDFDRILKERPNDYSALNARGRMFYLKKDYMNAIRDFTSAIESKPHDDNAYYNRALAYMKLRQYDKALPDMNKALEIDPKNINYLEFRAECYNYTDQPDLSIQDLEKVIGLDTTKTDAMQNVAFCYIMKKQYARADSLYARLYAREPGNAYVLSNYGYAQHKTGHTESGMKLINRSLELMPKNSYAYKYLALIYLDLNKKKDACQAMDKGLKLGFTQMYGKELEELQSVNCK